MASRSTSKILPGLLLILALFGCQNKSETTHASTAHTDSAQTAAPAVNLTEPHWIEPRQTGAKVAIVFVHGLFGDIVSSWTNPGGNGFFNLITQDASVGPKVDMFAFGYTSNFFKSGSFSIQDAAKRLHAHLESNRVLDYPAVVFVAHSMGGLVVLRELINHRELIDRIPVLVLYATPQEGAQIAAIGDHVAHNPALVDMFPADRNHFLQLLDDEWKGLPKRPSVQCAYELRKTDGWMIVPRGSATRFCDNTLAVDADHISIVKPTSAQSDSMILLKNALNNFVIGKQFEAKLETPDFHLEDGNLIFNFGSQSIKRNARLVNSGRAKLSYSLNEFPDHGLYVSPSIGPASIEANSTQTLQFALLFDAMQGEYRFTLHSDASNDRTVIVRIPDLAQLKAQQKARHDAILKELQPLLDKSKDPQQWTAEANGAVQDVIANLARESIAKREPELAEDTQWMLTAELLNNAARPDLAESALRRAVLAQTDIMSSPRLRSLLAEMAGSNQQRNLRYTGIQAMNAQLRDSEWAQRNVLIDASMSQFRIKPQNNSSWSNTSAQKTAACKPPPGKPSLTQTDPAQYNFERLTCTELPTALKLEDLWSYPVLTVREAQFDTAKAQLKPGNLPDIEVLAEYLKSNEQRTVIVAGFSDSSASSYVRRQAELRAEAVKALLVDYGVDPERIMASGFDLKKPEGGDSGISFEHPGVGIWLSDKKKNAAGQQEPPTQTPH